LVDRDGLLNLALFCGSFDREAAAQVAGVQLPTLFALLDAALIQRDGSGRYTLHELLRRYLTERLAADSTRTAELGARHANCFSVLLSTHLQQHIPLSTALAQLKPIVDDVRAAWRWAVANDALILLDTMLPYLDRYYKVRSAYQEAADTFGATIVSLATRPASVERRTMLARLRACCGAALGRLGRYAEGTAMLDAALPDLAHYGSPAARLMALVPRGEIAYASGDLATVQACVDAIEAHLDTVDDPGTRGRIWQSLGWLWGNLRQYHKARRAHNESLALMEILDDEHGMAAALNSLGIVTSRLGDVPRARGYHERSLQLAEQIGFQFGVLVAVNNLGTLAFESGDYAAAEAYYQAALAQFRDLGYRSNIAGALINLGIAAKEQHDTQHARRYFVEARQVSIDAGHQKLATHADFELADLAASDGEITYAEASYRRCLAFWEQSGDLTMESLTQRRLGGLALQRADLQHARVALQAALQLAHQVEEQGLMADVLLLAAELLQRREAHTQAAEILDAIIQAEGVRHSDRQIALTRRAALAHIPRTTADSTQSLHTCIAHLLNEGMH
jgi:tetratricopeptide (TPR) repeat protein